MKYSPAYFKNSMPDWKKKKDPMVSRFFYRPLSFYVASLCANFGISANSMSYFSVFVALIGCFSFLVNDHAWHIFGAVMFNVWLLLDCVDGNLARSVRKQAFGEFADATSSYTLVAFMCTCMAFAVYYDGGLILNSGWIWIILVGALSSTGDTLMRLIYQKYLNSERELVDQGVLEPEKDVFKDHSQVSSLSVFFVETMGIGGILPSIILLATIFHALDIVLLYCFIYYFCSSVIMILKYIFKAIAKSRKCDLKLTTND